MKTITDLVGVFDNATLFDGEYVYFAKNGDMTKIGWSFQPEARIVQISRANPGTELIGYVPGSRGLEQALHKALNEYRVHGEWFRLPDGMVGTLLTIGSQKRPSVPRTEHSLRLPSVPLELDLMERLEDYCRRTGATKTATVKLALAAFLPAAVAAWEAAR